MKQAKRALALVVCLVLLVPALVPAVSAYTGAGGAGASGALLPDEGNENGCGAQTVWIDPGDLRREAESTKEGAEELVREKKDEAMSFAEQTIRFAIYAAQSAGEWILGVINNAINTVMNLLFGNRDGGAAASGGAVNAAAVASAKIAGEKSILLAVLCGATAALTAAAILSKVALVPLYSHIPEGKALDNPQRKKIYETIQANPGIRISELAKIAGIGWGATVYHITVLEKGNYIASSVGSRSAGLFENNGRYTREERKVKSLLSIGKSSLVLDYVRTNPGSSSGAISGALGLSNPITSWYTQKLCEYGLIRKARNGKSVAHYPIESAVAGGASAQ